jgi:hypothetical protein
LTDIDNESSLVPLFCRRVLYSDWSLRLQQWEFFVRSLLSLFSLEISLLLFEPKLR